MKLKLFCLLVLIFKFNAVSAAGCENGSLKGPYTYQVTNSTSGDSEHLVGRIFFDGSGSVSVGGLEAYSGQVAYGTSIGTYSVSSACVASGSIRSNQTGLVTTFWIYLDNIDITPVTFLAYRGAFIVKTRYGAGSGEIQRVQGKF